MEKIINDTSLAAPFQVSTDQIGSWQRGILYFNEENCKFVFNELERQYGIIFQSNLLFVGLNFTGAIPTDDLDQAIRIVCYSADFQFTQLNNVLTIF